MKKSFIFILVLLLLPYSLISQILPLFDKNMKEKLKGYEEIKGYVYFYRFGEINKEKKLLYHSYTCDIKGNILNYLEYDLNSANINRKIVYKYNQANMPIEEIRYNVKGIKNSYESIKYHTGDTVKAERVIEDYGGKNTKTIIKYDDKGNEIHKESSSSENIKLETITENIYNEQNQLVQKIKNQKAYDKRGDVLRTYSPDTINYIYDNNGSLVSIIGDGDNVDEYYENGFLIEQRLDSYIFKYEYHITGLIKEMITCDKDGEPLMTIVCEYK